MIDSEWYEYDWLSLYDFSNYEIRLHMGLPWNEIKLGVLCFTETATIVCFLGLLHILVRRMLMVYFEFSSGDVMHYDVHKAWEFDESFPVRSPFIWYLLFWYPFHIIRIMKMFGIIQTLDSYWLLVIPRFMVTLLSLLTDVASTDIFIQANIKLL